MRHEAWSRLQLRELPKLWWPLPRAISWALAPHVWAGAFLEVSPLVVVELVVLAQQQVYPRWSVLEAVQRLVVGTHVANAWMATKTNMYREARAHNQDLAGHKFGMHAAWMATRRNWSDTSLLATGSWKKLHLLNELKCHLDSQAPWNLAVDMAFQA